MLLQESELLQIKELLAGQGMFLSRQQQHDEVYGFSIRGDTFEHDQMLRQIGGHWSNITQEWIFDSGKNLALLTSIIGDGNIVHDRLRESATSFDHDIDSGEFDDISEIILKHGAEHLKDGDLLFILLSLIGVKQSARKLSTKILAQFGGVHCVVNSETELLEYCSEDKKILVTFKIVDAIIKRLLKRPMQEQKIIGSHSALFEYLKYTMGYCSVELMSIIFLDVNNRLIKDEIVSRGTVDFVPLFEREIAKKAILCSASSIIMAHNHPSGNPKPSSEDIAMTKNVNKALKLLGIKLLDHVIVARNKYVSFRGQRLI